MNRMPKFGVVVAALVAAAVVIFFLATAVEHILVTGLWYDLRQRFLFWENLYFAYGFGARHRESTSRLAIVLGAVGAVSWVSVSSRNYVRGVALAFVGSFALAYFFTHPHTFHYVLALVTMQVSLVVAFVSFDRRAELSRLTWRFKLRALFGLATLVAVLLVLPRMVDHKRLVSIIIPDRTMTWEPVNVFLLLLGFSAGITTIAFASNSNVRPDRRNAFLVVVALGTFAYGYCVAWMFENVPALHWGRGGLSSFPFNGRNFHYAYAVLFPLAGFITVATAPILNRLTDAMRRLFTNLQGKPQTQHISPETNVQ